MLFEYRMLKHGEWDSDIHIYLWSFFALRAIIQGPFHCYIKWSARDERQCREADSLLATQPNGSGGTVPYSSSLSMFYFKTSKYHQCLSFLAKGECIFGLNISIASIQHRSYVTLTEKEFDENGQEPFSYFILISIGSSPQVGYGSCCKYNIGLANLSRVNPVFVSKIWSKNGPFFYLGGKTNKYVNWSIFQLGV